MKLKPAVILATFVVALGLLLGTSAARATEVILDGDGNVLQILDLPVTNGGIPTVYDVDSDTPLQRMSMGQILNLTSPPQES